MLLSRLLHSPIGRLFPVNDRVWQRTAFAMVAAKLYLVAAQPCFAIPIADKDDGLFLKLARHLLDGQWLGPYDTTTLAKGAGYPLFIALASLTGLPLNLAQHLLYLAAVWLLTRAARPLLPGPGWAFALFALLWWNPMSYEMSVLGRVIRQNIYTPFAMMVIAGAIALHTRRDASGPIRTAWAMLLGLAAGGMWITREETVWIVPTTLLLATTAFTAAWWPRRTTAAARAALWPVLLAGGLAVLPGTIVAQLNHRHYGWRGTCEFRSREFVTAYGALSRVVPPDGPKPYIPISRATREIIYPASPAFAELRSQLEGPAGLGAAGPSSPYTGLDPAQLEIAGGWFMWALRDAVQQTPHAHDARAALAFYARLAAEVNAACNDGLLPALPPRATLFPVWHSFYTRKARQQLFTHVHYFARFRGFTAHTPPSIGTAEGLIALRDLTQWRHSPSNSEPQLTMHYTERLTRPRITLLHHLGQSLCSVNFVLLGFGLAGWTLTPLAGLGRRSWPSYLWWVATAAWGATLSVLTITFLIDLTSFSQHNPGYLSHAYPMAQMGAFCSVAALWLAIRRSSVSPPLPPLRA